MRIHPKSKRVTPVRKRYHRPECNLLGSVQQLTLKLGSLTDGGQAGNFQ